MTDNSPQIILILISLQPFISKIIIKLTSKGSKYIWNRKLGIETFPLKVAGCKHTLLHTVDHVNYSNHNIELLYNTK